MPWYALCMPDISGSMPFLLLSYRRDSGCLTVSWCRTYETSKSIRGLEVTWKRCHSAVAALPNSLGTTWKLRITHIEYLRVMQPNMNGKFFSWCPKTLRAKITVIHYLLLYWCHSWLDQPDSVAMPWRLGRRLTKYELNNITTRTYVVFKLVYTVHYLASVQQTHHAIPGCKSKCTLFGWQGWTSGKEWFWRILAHPMKHGSNFESLNINGFSCMHTSCKVKLWVSTWVTCGSTPVHVGLPMIAGPTEEEAGMVWPDLRSLQVGPVCLRPHALLHQGRGAVSRGSDPKLCEALGKAL